MKKYLCLEIAKTAGFFGLGYWGLVQYNSWFVALLCGMLGSAIVALTWRALSR